MQNSVLAPKIGNGYRDSDVANIWWNSYLTWHWESLMGHQGGIIAEPIVIAIKTANIDQRCSTITNNHYSVFVTTYKPITRNKWTTNFLLCTERDKEIVGILTRDKAGNTGLGNKLITAASKSAYSWSSSWACWENISNGQLIFIPFQQHLYQCHHRRQ